MNNVSLKKRLIPWLPYGLIGLFATNLGEAWRLAAGTDASQKLLGLVASIPLAFATPLPSFHPFDLLVGLCSAGLLRLAVYLKSKNAKKYRKGVEYGSARWGTPADIAPYVDPVFQQNVILTQTERLTMSSRPKEPKYARNKNVLVIGGSGSGKTRFFVKPNLMQLHSSYVITDPKGTILLECGTLLQRGSPKRGEDGKVLRDLAAFRRVLNVHVNGPPLSTLASLSKFLPCLWEVLPEERRPGEPVIFAGHGHADGRSDFAYMALNSELKKLDPDFHAACVEGKPDLESLLPHLRGKRVWILPFLMVAGEHVRTDLAGEGRESWRSRLSERGFEVRTRIRGLGEFPAVADSFTEGVL